MKFKQQNLILLASLVVGASSLQAKELKIATGYLPDVFTQFGAVNEISITAEGVANGCVNQVRMAEIDRLGWNIENEHDVAVESLATKGKFVYKSFHSNNPKYSHLPRERPRLTMSLSVFKASGGFLNEECSLLPIKIRGQRLVVMPTALPKRNVRTSDAPRGGWSLPKSGEYSDVLAVKSLGYKQFAKKFLTDKTLPKNGINNYHLTPEPSSVYIVLESEKGKILEPVAMRYLEEITTQVNTRVSGVDRSTVFSLWTPNLRWTEVTQDGFRGDTVVPSRLIPGPNYSSPDVYKYMQDNVERANLIGYMVNKDRSATLLKLNLISSNSRHLYPQGINDIRYLRNRQQYIRRWVEPLTQMADASQVENSLQTLVEYMKKKMPSNLKIHVAVVYNNDFPKGFNPDPLHAWTDEQKAEAKKKYPFIFE